MSESDEGSVFDPDEEPAQPSEGPPEQSQSRLLSGIVPVILSLVAPGVGHVSRGLWWRGVLWFALALGSAILIPLGVVFLWLHFAVRVVSAIDAWRATGTGVFAHWISALAVSLVVFAGLRIFLFEGFKIPSASMAPTLQIGDHLMTNKAAYWFEEPARGDVIVFEYPCNGKVDFVKRVVAVGGDTVEVRCDRLFVNGDKVDDEFIDEPCEYLDHDGTLLGITAGSVRVETFCSRYRETLGDESYEVLYSADRPRLDQTIREARAGDLKGGLNPLLLRGRRDFPIAGAGPPRCHEVSGAAVDAGVVSEIREDGFQCKPRGHYTVPDGHVFVLGDNRDNASDSRRWGSVPMELIKGRVTYLWWAAPPGGDVNWGRIGGI